MLTLSRMVTSLIVVVFSATVSFAFTADSQRSVVSVLPVWPGQVQGGTGAPPGVAPEGSGVAIAPGLVATAWHVIEPAEEIEVRLSDGRILPATLVAADPATDIAILSVEVSLVPFEPADAVELVEPVCAFGNAFGLGVSVTCGVVSALGVSDAGFNDVEDFVQTDAAINPGMSGGALVDAEGRLVGMVSAIFASEGDANIGVNFAVSSELLLRVTDALVRDGEVRLPDAGWRLGYPDRSAMARVAAPVVRAVTPDGPAQVAGVRQGDLIVEIGGRRIETPRDAASALALLPQDAREVSVRVDRGGREELLPLVFADDPGPEAMEDSVAITDCPYPASVCVLRQAVFPISSFDPVGSATRIAPDLLVTNRHVVGDRAEATVFTPDGPLIGRIVASGYRGDLVLLEVDGLPEDGLVPVLSATDANEGPFFAVGADVARQEIRVFDPGALISEPDKGAQFGRLHVAARMQPGVSGGALVTEEGALAGVAVGGGDGRFEAIPIRDVLALLSLREDRSAAETTAALGRSFAACAALIETASSGAETADWFEELSTTCRSADNHGQLLEAGRVLARAGEFDAAASLHGAAVAQVPNSLNALISLLVSLQLGARFEDMIPHARRVMELAPHDPQVLRFAIQSGVWGGDAALAEKGYEALLAADPVQAQAARRFIDSAPPAPVRR